ncbi:M56 family metallopeptidase [Pedobacter sp. KR3-3]|uniref:M56 family metallopeptidase n=1 Tax=Pedobacter albus TaxID=3113905 RepID=A0ABU7I3K7_9SPHI|nr:M56 family metallopeptidase [Pedobacter sp. KR3-3]MEE1943941.1 M56 family metallopeptidase [Pedobacter sp. KR3-3]
MPHFFVILLKINLVLILFGATYYLVLRRLTFYTLNRIFLVFGILFSTVYPFINLTDFFHSQKEISQKVAFVPELNQKAAELVPSQFIALNWQLLTVLFYAGVVLMALRLLVQFISLYRMHRRSAPGQVANYPVRVLEEPVSPFSFWQTVYINPSMHKEKELATILEHEKVHVKQWHSLDIILAELSVVFYWFNPGVWLMKKAVKENLEFITDEKILKKGVDRKTYQYSLLDVGNLTPSVAIVNNFNLSDLKKRIKMMNAKRSSRLTLSRYLFALPILLLTTLAFTVSKKDIDKHLAPLTAAIAHTIAAQDTTEVVPQQQQQAVRKRKPQAVARPADSVTVAGIMLRRIDINADSLKAGHVDLPGLLDDEKTREMIVEALKGKVQGKNTMLVRRDSLSGTGMMKGRVKSVKIEFKGRIGQPLDRSEFPNDQVIVVKGYATKRTPSDSTTINVSDRLNYYINGVKVSAEEMKKSLEPKLVKGITLKKNDNQETNFMIETKH